MNMELLMTYIPEISYILMYSNNLTYKEKKEFILKFKLELESIETYINRGIELDKSMINNKPHPKDIERNWGN